MLHCDDNAACDTEEEFLQIYSRLSLEDQAKAIKGLRALLDGASLQEVIAQI